VIGLLEALVRADSQNPPGREAEAADILASYLHNAGLAVEVREVESGRPNVIARLAGDSPEALLLNGHLDTVPGRWEPRWEGERFYGRGACDMKAGLAAMAYALARVARHQGRKRSVLFTAVIDEEVWFKGTKSLIADGALADCVCGYVAEPTSLTIATSLQGAAEFTLRTSGRASHAGMAELGDNAIRSMLPLLAALAEYADSLRGKGANLGLPVDPSVNIGTIRGGEVVTMVPADCEVAFDRQILPGESVADVVAEVQRVVPARLEQSFPPWQIDSGHDVVRALADAHLAALGKPAQTSVFRAYCEVELLAAAGIPAVIYGPGSIEQAHRPDEYVNKRELAAAAQVYERLISDFTRSSQEANQRVSTKFADRSNADSVGR
jgi:acetylornithine deacetylase/succinyl-diaminopimelate desuccinylase-like protein